MKGALQTVVPVLTKQGKSKANGSPENSKTNTSYSTKVMDQFDTLRIESGFVDHEAIEGVLPEVIKAMRDRAPKEEASINWFWKKHKQIIAIDYQALEGAEGANAVRLNYIRNYLMSAIACRDGTYSYRPVILSYIACGLPGLTLSKFFPDNSERSLLYSNILFTAATLLSRSLLHKAASINQNIEYFKAHYKDLEEYVEELFGLGVFKRKGANFEYTDELNKIERIVLESWSQFMDSKKINDFTTMNRYKVIDISLNMFKALARYLIIRRTEELKELIHNKAVSIGFNPENITGEINYVHLLKQYEMDKRSLISSIKPIELGDGFIKKIVTEFSAMIENKSVEMTDFYKAFKRVGPHHIRFKAVPDIMPFLNVLYRNGCSSSENSFHPMSEHHKSNFIKDVSAVKSLQLNLAKLDLFTGKNRLMEYIGVHIKNRAGTRFPWFLNECLSVISGMLGGLPIFTFIYQKQNSVTAAQYVMPSVLWAFSYGVENIKNKINAEEKRFDQEYKEYEIKISKLVQKEHIQIKNFDGNILDNADLECSENFKMCMDIIAKVIAKTYEKANLDINSLSHKEDAFFALRLFNAFGDVILSFGGEMPLDKKDSLVDKLSDHCASKISKGRLGAAYRGCQSAAYFSAGLSKKDVINHIASELTSGNITKEDVAVISRITRSEAVNGNSAYFR